MIGDHHIWELLLGSPVCFDRDLFAEAFDRRVVLTNANKIHMVPKTAKTHRSIAIEPLLNGYVQKGIDQYLRRRLKRYWSMDLADQSRNQLLAQLGSEGGSNPFATIDLASASDSISIEVVRELLPPDWFLLLNATRSTHCQVGDTELRYEKFASMGNGFCFPLETLIFASIVHSVYAETGDRGYAVYGDDIIVRQSAALLVIERLHYLGFRVNVEKTFIHGPFRESCGADFFEGENIRPYYLDQAPLTWPAVYGLLNGLRRIGASQTWTRVLAGVPPRRRLYRPCEGPDTCITVDFDVFMTSPYARWDRDTHRWSYRELLSVAVLDNGDFSPPVQMYGALRGSPSQDGSVVFALRRKTRTLPRQV
jgi:hypothetical protein